MSYPFIDKFEFLGYFVRVLNIENHGDVESLDVLDLIKDTLEFIFRGFSGCMIKV